MLLLLIKLPKKKQKKNEAVPNLAITEEKENNRSDKSNVKPGLFLYKVTTDINFTDEAVVQWDVSYQSL